MTAAALPIAWLLLALWSLVDAIRRRGPMPGRLASGLAYALWVEGLAGSVGAYQYPASWYLGSLPWPAVLWWTVLYYLTWDGAVAESGSPWSSAAAELTAIMTVVAGSAFLAWPLGLISAGSNAGWMQVAPGGLPLGTFLGVPWAVVVYWGLASGVYTLVRQRQDGTPACLLAGLLLHGVVGTLWYSGAVGWLLSGGTLAMGVGYGLWRRCTLRLPTLMAIASLTCLGGYLVCALPLWSGGGGGLPILINLVAIGLVWFWSARR